ncbi:DUF167 domain-containing protein [Agitococcus lubricus]|uniref:UPF0235 protein C8N29_101217 n=1 Tax=Agitococcus lubricus TaxID=1077255 RepID=A0A2T5J3G2_9GAMM|nr:DUF167 family protein [Agitococcus lubricus]PTQ91145.1 hypothetical protein C8N29_101217 [Agitococcus lubricus]
MATEAIQQHGSDLVLNLHVQPNAARSEFVGLHGQALKVRLHAPPVDGKANDELCRFLAHIFAVNKKSVQLLSGETTRTKRVRVQNVVCLPPSIIKILQGVVS